MVSLREILTALRSADGRIRVATLFGISGLVAVLAVFLVLPAFAGSGDPSGGTEDHTGVQPDEVSYGGGSGACAVFSDAALELHINNPVDGTFTGPDGTQVAIDVGPNDMYFEFHFLNHPTMFAYDVIVNGGSKNTHFDYIDSIGAVRDDTALHPPTKGGSKNLYNLSHINICYDVRPLASVSGVKYHDHDTDGFRDLSAEDGGLDGWTIAALDQGGNVAGSATTADDGSYTISGLESGDYTICEATTDVGLGEAIDGDLSGVVGEGGFSWAWTQSDLTLPKVAGEPIYPDYAKDVCGEGYEPNGHQVTVGDGDLNGIDFGNHTQLSVTCDDGLDVVVSLGKEGLSDNPLVTATFPAGCESVDFTTSFDVGRSNDADTWDQFFVFGGDPASDTQITLETVWDAEDAKYVDGSGDACTAGDAGCSLLVPTTQVELAPGGGLQPEVMCSSGLPNSDTPICLQTRTILEGQPLEPGLVQLTETSLVLGDPRGFR